ncbi:MAG: TetR/AcrR family transcriptional regulator [Paludibacteraceae bacterium]|nr:TetR/AcrR family transcriptional regulator [Paludibacteraceae bacterium]MBP3717153.1 TetR/AcrR family transcriptional regulator [Paludibacteraceae bacterium]
MIESQLRTKALLVDVARQLFAEKGFGATTMNDIAELSNKGRRTLYTYFKSKEEIYSAVIKTELNIISDNLKSVVGRRDLDPDEKLVQYINVRMDAVKDVVIRNGELKAEFFLNTQLVEKVRRRLDFHEKNILKDILIEGMEKGMFERRDPEFAALCMHYCLKGFELPYIRGEFDRITLRKRELIIDMLMNGLRRRHRTVV